MQAMLEKMVQEQIKGQLNKKLSDSLGVSNSQAKDMIENSLPYLLGGLKKNTGSKEGAESLLEALKSGKHDGQALEKLEELAKNPESGEGAGILKHVLGDKEAAVEAEIAKKSGVDPEKAKKSLMVMAPMVMAMLGKMVQSDKLNADKLSEIVSDLAKNKDLGGAGMKVAMQFLDQDGDGEVKDDFIRMAQKHLGKLLSGK